MIHLRLSRKHGFTLIELLVVIAIIGVLASVVLASLNAAREKSRDAARKAALKQIQSALELYYSDNGTYVVSGSGSNGSGNGWFSYQGGVYATSVAQALATAGYTGGVIVDPSGATTSSGGQTGYMIAADANGYTLWANLENPSAEDTATQNTCRHSTYDNFHSSYAADARINYCISN